MPKGQMIWFDLLVLHVAWDCKGVLERQDRDISLQAVICKQESQGRYLFIHVVVVMTANVMSWIGGWGVQTTELLQDELMNIQHTTLDTRSCIIQGFMACGRLQSQLRVKQHMKCIQVDRRDLITK